MKTAKQVIRERFLKNAIDCTYYVATSRHLAEEIAKETGESVETVKNMMSTEAVNLHDQFKAMVEME